MRIGTAALIVGAMTCALLARGTAYQTAAVLPDVQTLGPQVGNHVPEFTLLDQMGQSDYSKRRGITFPLLSDPGSRTIKRYGILNTTIPESNQQSFGVPFPGTFML